MNVAKTKNEPASLDSRRIDTKKMVTLAMLAAVAYVVMVVGRIPVVSFLKYDPKDVVIAIGGLMYGPLAAAAISVVVSFVEMLTVSDTGPIGLIMNVLSTCAFACTASFIYKKRHSMSGAVIGLVAGAIFMTVVMILWNYLITPIYLGYPRQAVADMLIPVFLPFNLLKAGLNSALTILLYKPIVGSLRKAKLIPESGEEARGGIKWGLMICAGLVLVTGVLLVLVMRGII